MNCFLSDPFFIHSWTYAAHKTLLCWISPTITVDPTVGLALRFSPENRVHVRPWGQTSKLEKSSTGLDFSNHNVRPYSWACTLF